jgi:hypothetical protein
MKKLDWRSGYFAINLSNDDMQRISESFSFNKPKEPNMTEVTVKVDHENPDTVTVNGVEYERKVPELTLEQRVIAELDELVDAAVEACHEDRSRIEAASSKPWLHGVSPWQFAMLLEVMSIEDDCSAPSGDVDGLLERAWRYLQKARGEV